MEYPHKMKVSTGGPEVMIRGQLQKKITARSPILGTLQDGAVVQVENVVDYKMHGFSRWAVVHDPTWGDGYIALRWLVPLDV